MSNDAVCRLCRHPTRSTQLDSTGTCEVCHPPVGLVDVLDRLPTWAAEPIRRLKCEPLP
jgi:hypothetical protein